MVKVAVTVRAVVIATVQLLVPVQAPVQPENVFPELAVADKVTDLPLAYSSVQSEPQLIPAGELATVPVPVPDLITVRV